MTYDEQIAILTENPRLIADHWLDGVGLFKFIGNHSHLQSGCLTMIRNDKYYVALIQGEVNEKITAQIRADERIPKDSKFITVSHLPVFKEWQERIDKLQNYQL